MKNYSLDPTDVLKMIVSGGDPNWNCPEEENRCTLHQGCLFKSSFRDCAALMIGNIALLELLLWNGANPSTTGVQDSRLFNNILRFSWQHCAALCSIL